MSGGVIHSCRVSEEELDVLPTPPSFHRLTSPATDTLHMVLDLNDGTGEMPWPCIFSFLEVVRLSRDAKLHAWPPKVV
jgi:hypothetical protein